MKKYDIYELEFKGAEPKESEARINLHAEFKCKNKTYSVNGFYAGNNIYKIRFMPLQEGEYIWIVTGLFNDAGSFICRGISKENKGPIRTEKLHFKYDNGDKYLPFGTTVYALIHQPKILIDQTMATLKNSPFNKVRLCLFPKHYLYNQDDPELYPYRQNEDGTFNVNKPCYEYWENLESRIVELGKLGIEADLILLHSYDKWGFSSFSKEDFFIYFDYVIRRLSAFPNIWWSLANEYELCVDIKREWWDEFADYIGKKDIYHHLLSNHNIFGYWDFNNKDTTHCSIQGNLIETVPEIQKQYNKPVIFDETQYEGTISMNWGNISAAEMVHKFWTVFVSGGYCTHGETIPHDNDILWWSKGGMLLGESPARIKFLKDIIYSLPGPLTFDGYNHTQFPVKRVKYLMDNPSDIVNEKDNLIKAILNFPKDQITEILLQQKSVFGRYKDEALLYYNGNHCNKEFQLELPETGSFTVYVIDSWNMTKEKISTNASIKINTPLPGKVGMAILAIRNKK